VVSGQWSVVGGLVVGGRWSVVGGLVVGGQGEKLFHIFRFSDKSELMLLKNGVIQCSICGYQALQAVENNR